jgi:hypothetical protein
MNIFLGEMQTCTDYLIYEQYADSEDWVVDSNLAKFSLTRK